MAAKPRPVYVTDTANSTVTTHILPAGTRVYLSAPGVHYHPKYWPDPYKLDPNRWTTFSSAYNQTSESNTDGGKRVLAADKTRQMRGTLLTFSDGARACLGRKFAQAEYIAFLVASLRDYKVGLAPGYDAKVVERDLYLKSGGKLTLAPFSHVKFSLEKRKK
jgi:cytochrome P450